MQSNFFSNEIQEILNTPVEWTQLLQKDPRRILVESKESFTVFRTLTDLFDLPLDHKDVLKAKQILLEDPQVEYLLDNLSDWEKEIVKGHNRAQYLPNQLWLLLDWGMKPEDDERIQSAIDKILSHQDEETGQFLAHIEAYDRKAKQKYPMWSSALCDHNMIMAVLLLAGLKENNNVKYGLERMNELIKDTTQGRGWKCEPWLHYKRRGPGRVQDVCPMIVADALRGYWKISEKEWPKGLIEAGYTLLNCWSRRSEEKPYMFGHGKNFRLPRAPFFWYNIGTILDAVRHYPKLIQTQAFQELVAISLLNSNQDGLFIPQTVYLYFKDYSFGQKKGPSPWMTLFFSRIYKDAVESVPNIIEMIKKIDAKSLKGSKGGPKNKK